MLELRSAYDPGRTEAAYYSAIEGKTAALFATACRVGAIVGGLPRDDVDRLTDFGRHYGMAFQVVDDVLDVVADEATLGKPAAHDIAEGIYNLPVLRALAAGGPDAERLRSMLGGPVAGAELAAARDLVRGSVGVEESIAVASGYVDQAIATLAPLGERPTSTAWPALAGRPPPCSRPLLTDLRPRASGGCPASGGQRRREAAAADRTGQGDQEGDGEAGPQASGDRPVLALGEGHGGAAHARAQRGAERVAQLQGGRRTPLLPGRGQAQDHHRDR